MFLTHDWGTDELRRSNHSRVANVNSHLRNLGVKTWFDSQQLSGNIQEQMAAGIENSKVVVVFVTKRYMDKVGQIESPENPNPNPSDNCKREFLHAVNSKTPSKMIAVVMEPRMKDTSQWKGPLGFNLGSELYVNMSSDDHLDRHCEDLVELIKQKLGPESTTQVELETIKTQ